MPHDSFFANQPARCWTRCRGQFFANFRGIERMRRPVNIAPPKGKLGVLTPGMGAVSTTFMAGVELVRRGESVPVGSLTQLGTIRLGKRTEGRTPKISEFVPLAKLDDIVFG